jgi:uncharacterized membrane protein YgcG
MFAMRASWRKGLSGAVSAIVIAVVLVAGLASASYINLTAARYNEAQMQEALRQARLGSELIRMHIHSTDGAVDSPPRITFVNAWGYESRIIQLVVVGRNMEPRATIDLRDRPIVLPPGARLTIDPAQIGLSYPTFKRMADEVRSVFAYTEAGNSFGSTWSFPREDNMAGRTVAVTYNVSTTELWYVPSVTFLNRTWAKFYYTTIGEIPPLQQATIKARNHFEKASVGAVVLDGYGGAYGWSISTTIGDPVVEGYPAAPIGSGASFIVDTTLSRWNRYGYASWWWKPEAGFTTLEGTPAVVEANTYVAIVNRPTRLVVTATINYGSSYCTASYRLRYVTITPNPPDYQPPAPRTTIARTGMVISFTHTTVQLHTCWDTGCGYTLSYPAASGPVRTAFNTMTGWLLYDGAVVGGAYGWGGARLNAPLATRAPTTYYGQGPAYFPYYGLNGIDWPYFRGVVLSLTTNTYAGNDLSAIYVKLPPGNYTVDRYYYVEGIQCNIYVPSPEISYSGGGPPVCFPNCNPPPPPRCPVYLESKTSPAPSGGGGGGGGGRSGGGGGADSFNIFQNILRYRSGC